MIEGFNFPDDSQRLTIVGKTGSGKTLAAAWHLSQRDFHLRPWVIIDFKRDKLLNSIGASEISLNSPAPSKPGLYIVHPQANDKEGMEKFLWRIWARGECGIYVDEGYMIDPRSDAFQAIITQGRSKHIPIIILSQRPVFLSRFAISEADFLQCFKLNDARDRATVNQYLPAAMNGQLPRYYSQYYDVGEDKSFILKPVPNADSLKSIFRKRIAPNRKML